MIIFSVACLLLWESADDQFDSLIESEVVSENGEEYAGDGAAALSP